VSSKRLAFEISLLCCCAWVYIPLSVVLGVEAVVVERVVVVV